MSSADSKESEKPPRGKKTASTKAVLRGLGVFLPPLLTILVFLWIWSSIENYVLKPVEGYAQNVIVWAQWDVLEKVPPDAQVNHDKDGKITSIKHDGVEFSPLESGKFIPMVIYEKVSADPGEPAPTTALSYYHRYIRLKYLQRIYVIPIFLSVFVIVLYCLGKFMAAGAGRFIGKTVESMIHRLPVIRNVYSSVKQVTDFVFSEREIEFNRVVAVQYPRKGIWSIGFVTGDSLLDIRSSANEPVLSVLMPTSPMPMTGFTVTVLKSETIDLDITIDQAIQFVVSCGVVVPSNQINDQNQIRGKIASAISNQNQQDQATTNVEKAIEQNP